jgi:hypothetical protein
VVEVLPVRGGVQADRAHVNAIDATPPTRYQPRHRPKQAAARRRGGGGSCLEKSFLCTRLRGLVDLNTLVPVHFHVDDDVGLAEVVDEGRVDGLRRFISTRKEVDLLGVRA